VRSGEGVVAAVVAAECSAEGWLKALCRKRERRRRGLVVKLVVKQWWRSLQQSVGLKPESSHDRGQKKIRSSDDRGKKNAGGSWAEAIQSSDNKAKELESSENRGKKNAGGSWGW
jgi:hypothetical protein